MPTSFPTAESVQENAAFVPGREHGRAPDHYDVIDDVAVVYEQVAGSQSTPTLSTGHPTPQADFQPVHAWSCEQYDLSG